MQGLMCIQQDISITTVTDCGEGVCVDPGEKGAILEAGGPARQEREKAGS
jgi:hypothetical protein